MSDVQSRYPNYPVDMDNSCSNPRPHHVLSLRPGQLSLAYLLLANGIERNATRVPHLSKCQEDQGHGESSRGKIEKIREMDADGAFF